MRAHTVDGRNPFHTTRKPWENHGKTMGNHFWLVFTGDSSINGLSGCRISFTVSHGQPNKSQLQNDLAPFGSVRLSPQLPRGSTPRNFWKNAPGVDIDRLKESRGGKQENWKLHGSWILPKSTIETAAGSGCFLRLKPFVLEKWCAGAF